jgi:hypothetical protein
VQISFPQPHALRKKKSAEKRRWWEESKRLEEGVLLCMLWFDRGKSSLLFFTVSNKQTDPKSTHRLCSHGYLATITARLATTSQRDVELMMSKSPGKKVGILIEVPGVILATFIPILENLQDLQRLSRLPFRQWIVPDRLGHQDEDTSVVPPPLYVRDTKFKFSLKSILKDLSQDFLISPSSSPLIQKSLIN